MKKLIIINVVIFIFGMILGGFFLYSYDPSISSKIEIQKIKEIEQQEELDELRKESSKEELYQADCDPYNGCEYHESGYTQEEMDEVIEKGKQIRRWVESTGKTIIVDEDGIQIQEW